MEQIGLGMVIVGSICGLWLIMLIVWLVALIKHPGHDDFRLQADRPESRS